MSAALGSLESLTPTVSIETELAMEQLKERYEQEVQDLKIQLETKVKRNTVSHLPHVCVCV